jgi:PAS domain-containing protein
LAFALESAQQGFWEWVPQTDEISLFGHTGSLDESDLGCRITNGRQFLALTHPEDRNYLQEALSSYLRGESSSYSVEHRVRMRDGNYRTFLALGQEVERGSDGRITRMVGTHADITDSKTQQQRLELALRNGRQGLHEWRVFVGIGTKCRNRA